jgi:hypothetical protein
MQAFLCDRRANQRPFSCGACDIRRRTSHGAPYVPLTVFSDEIAPHEALEAVRPRREGEALENARAV